MFLDNHRLVNSLIYHAMALPLQPPCKSHRVIKYSSVMFDIPLTAFEEKKINLIQLFHNKRSRIINNVSQIDVSCLHAIKVWVDSN